MDTTSGKELTINGEPVTGKTEFIPEAADGSIEVEFTFDATGLEEINITVFEKLLNANGTVVAVHEDITDKDQTVEVKKIKIGTTATDKEDGDKTIISKGIVTIIDKISYENLIPGRMYTAEGVLMDKSTGKELRIDGKPITGKTEFIPEAADGSAEVEFTFDATGLGNIEVVVFEKLLNANGTVVAMHEDINDNEQTVKFEKPIGRLVSEYTNGNHKGSVKTGDSMSVTLFEILMLLSIAVMIMCYLMTRIEKENMNE